MGYLLLASKFFSSTHEYVGILGQLLVPEHLFILGRLTTIPLLPGAERLYMRRDVYVLYLESYIFK